MERKYFFILLLLTVILIGCNHPTDSSCLHFYGLNGEVKSVISETFTAVERFGEMQKDERLWGADGDSRFSFYPMVKREFDEVGNLIKETEYGKYLSIKQLNKYEYYNNHQVAHYCYDESGQLKYMKKMVIVDNSPIGYELHSKYGEYIVDFVIVTSNGYEFLHPNSDLNDKFEYEFEGMKVISQKRYQDGVLAEITENTYVDDKIKKSVTTDKYGSITKLISYEYTNDGQLSYAGIISNGEIVFEESKMYDERGLIVKYKRLNKSDSYSGNVEYEVKYLLFDEKGNWIKRAIYTKNKPLVNKSPNQKEYLLMEERQIEYFK